MVAVEIMITTIKSAEKIASPSEGVAEFPPPSAAEFRILLCEIRRRKI